MENAVFAVVVAVDGLAVVDGQFVAQFVVVVAAQLFDAVVADQFVAAAVAAAFAAAVVVVVVLLWVGWVPVVDSQSLAAHPPGMFWGLLLLLGTRPRKMQTSK